MTIVYNVLGSLLTQNNFLIIIIRAVDVTNIKIKNQILQFCF